MKKTFLMFGAAALLFAACSSDEAVQVNKGSEISFRANLAKETRAADMSLTNLSEFNVTALNVTKGTTFFDNQTFVKNTEGAYTHVGDKIWWPETDALNFYAYAPTSSAQYQYVDYKTFNVTPSTSVDSQLDLIYANTNGKTQATDKNGVALNFRHTESKIRVKVYNSEKNVTVQVSGWKIAHVAPAAKFSYVDNNTDVKNANTLSFESWSNWADATEATQYIADNATLFFDGVQENPVDMDKQMILVPQQLQGFTPKEQNITLDGSYIAVKILVKNKADGTVLYGGTEGKWCLWPISTKWEPGKLYTYVIDVCKGVNEEKEPVLNEIKFVDVTVDDWNEVLPWINLGASSL
jgi:uncharacterized protein YcfL